MVSVDPRVEGIRSVLVHLRTRTGLTSDRLRTTEVGVQTLIDLPVVRNVVQASGRDPQDAAVYVVRELARRLPPTDRLIADTALALGLLHDAGADPATVEPLYTKDLGPRREHLVTHWSELHQLCEAAEVPEPPSVRTLRTSVEPRTLERLAQLCVSALTLELAADAAGEASGAEVHAAAGQPSVAIVGGAVMDHIAVADRIPAVGTSVQASSFVRSPGGKALNQAVASARLGLAVNLIAAVGDDQYSETIVDYLHREGLRTDLVKRVPSASAPVAIVIVDQTGSSAALGWMNEGHIRLDPADVAHGPARTAIESAAAVILTFEAPFDALRTVFEVVRDSQTRVIVHPSPPMATPQLLYEHLSRVDYLVGTAWELRHLLPEPDQDVSTDQLIAQLLLLGVGAVCVVEHFSCLLRSNEQSIEIARLPSVLQDTPGARDAFSAALTFRLVTSGGHLTEADLTWAVAAMAATPSFSRIPNAMPSADEIGHILAISPDFEKK